MSFKCWSLHIAGSVLTVISTAQSFDGLFATYTGKSFIEYRGLVQYSCVDCIMSVKTGLRTIMRNRLGLTLTSVPTPTCTPRCNCETAQEDDISQSHTGLQTLY